MESVFYSEDMVLSRAWDAAGSAAATDSAVSLVKSAIGAGTRLVITGYTAGYSAASAAVPKLLTIQSGATVKKYVIVPVNGAVDVNLDPAQWIVCADNTNATVALAAGAATGAVGVASLKGFYIGKRT